MINEYFYSDKYDDRVVLEISNQKVTLKDLKNRIKSNNNDFVTRFFRAVLSGSEIILSSTGECQIKETKIANDKINPNEVFINFFTSGSTCEPKIIRKTLANLLSEQKDVYEKFKCYIGENTRFVSTAPMSHQFGMTFQFMLPFFSNHVIDCDRILYPEELDKKEDYVLVSTPSFLEKVVDYNFKNYPRLVITAGAKLNDGVFKKFPKIVEIYGSTETGVVAYRISPSSFTRFDNVDLKPLNNGILVKSDYFLEDEMVLNDKIEALNEKEFVLKDRTDRMVKINEKRVSLCEIEKILKGHKYVEDLSTLKHNEKLCAAVVLNENGRKFLMNNGRLEIIKKLKNFVSENNAAAPKKWRFVFGIPKNACGKTDNEKLKYLFDLKLTYPLILSENLSQHSAELELVFLKNSSFFKGHFEGYPILPGVVQLFFAQYFIENLFNIKLSNEKVKKVKFSNPILPDTKMKLRLNNCGENWEYTYLADDKVYSSGIFVR